MCVCVYCLAVPFNMFVDVQVGGQTLCLLCTINFKKAQFKKKVQEGKKETQNSSNKTLKQRDRDRDDE